MTRRAELLPRKRVERDIHWACAHVLGDKAAHDITMSQGVHWTRIIAMAAALTSHDPQALKILKEWAPEQDLRHGR